jgi:hypothetical protein
MVKIDIEMPTYCRDCPCCNAENSRCNITGDSTYEKRPFDCPLKEVKLADLPSAQPKRKKGKWIITDTYNNRVWHCNCPECGEDPQHFISGTEDWWINKLPNFCPNCGADMT